MPTDRRETACVYIRDGSDVLLLDAGTGMRRLQTDPDLLEGVSALHIALTHFHLDHVAGLVGLPGLAHLERRELWAPGRVVAGAPADAVVHRLLGPPFLAATPGHVTSQLLTQIHELTGDAEIGPFRVQTRVQPHHAGPTLAFKVRGDLAYCTDTAFDAANADFVRGATVLLHEAFHPTDSTEDTMHSASGEAARIAAMAGVDRLVICHVSPLLTDEEALLAPARARFAASEVGVDGPVQGFAA